MREQPRCQGCHATQVHATYHELRQSDTCHKMRPPARRSCAFGKGRLIFAVSQRQYADADAKASAPRIDSVTCPCSDLATSNSCFFIWTSDPCYDLIESMHLVH